MEDAAAATRKWLREATDSEGVRPDGIGTKSGGSVTFAELAAFAAPLAKEPKLNARYRALLELAAAVASALPGTSPRVDRTFGAARRVPSGDFVRDAFGGGSASR